VLQISAEILEFIIIIIWEYFFEVVGIGSSMFGLAARCWTGDRKPEPNIHATLKRLGV